MVVKGMSREDEAKEVVSQDGPKMLWYLVPFQDSKTLLEESDKRIRE